MYDQDTCIVRERHQRRGGAPNGRSSCPVRSALRVRVLALAQRLHRLNLIVERDRRALSLRCGEGSVAPQPPQIVGP